MARFSNPMHSHQHSLEVLELLREHDTFIESITTMADMGCGAGLDLQWWANLETRDEEGSIPLDITCWGVDKDISGCQIEDHKRITLLDGNFEKRVLSRNVDVIWCHDAFQYAINPLSTLKLFNEQMVTNGMLYIGMPLLSWRHLNRWHITGSSFQFYNHTFLSMVYMLAVNGFDCKDAYFRKRENDPWLHCAVFKTDKKPMDPASTSWHDLVDLGLIHDSLSSSIQINGFPRLEDALYPWLDKDLHRIAA